MQTTNNIAITKTRSAQQRSASAQAFVQNQHAFIVSVLTFVLLSLVLGTSVVNGQQGDVSRLEWNSSAIDRIVNSNQAPSSAPARAEARYDEQVVPTAFERAPERLNTKETWDANDVAKIQSAAQVIPTSTGQRLNFMQREESAEASSTLSNGMPKKESIGPMVANIGMNLAIVLFIGTGVVVLAKQWIIPQPKSEPATTTNSLQVKEVLMLDDKSKLQVIQWQSTHVLVASDSQGIRSVVPLMPTFSETMEDVETELDAAIRPAGTSSRSTDYCYPNSTASYSHSSAVDDEDKRST